MTEELVGQRLSFRQMVLWHLLCRSKFTLVFLGHKEGESPRYMASLQLSPDVPTHQFRARADGPLAAIEKLADEITEYVMEKNAE